jgi:hypothetical protein
MLYVQACFISYNNFFIHNPKLSLAFSILSVGNKMTNYYERPLLSISVRSVCCFKLLQQLGVWRELLFTKPQRNFLWTLLGEVVSENSMSDEWVGLSCYFHRRQWEFKTRRISTIVGFKRQVDLFLTLQKEQVNWDRTFMKENKL